MYFSFIPRLLFSKNSFYRGLEKVAFKFITQFPLVHLCFISLMIQTTSLFANPHRPSANDVVVVANVNSPESLELANFYLTSRGIPKDHLVVVKTTTSESISREVFVNEILNPLRVQLLEKKLIDGEIISNDKDFHGRYGFNSYATHFKYLVICKGVPLKIQNQLIPEPGVPDNLPKKFRTTRASVDSDLALISAPNKPLISWQKNPLYEVKNPSKFDYTTAISVCRLDGPTLEDAKNLVTQAIKAESQRFIQGRAYIDLNSHHRDGNIWLRRSASLLQSYGYDVDTIPNSRHWSLIDRNEAPAIYLGWYQSNASGPMISHSQSIPTGSIAAHIHSYSAGTVQNPTAGWVGPLIHAGYAVTFGNVFEPYLQLTLRPDRFIEHLLKGYSVGDASLYAQNTLSWQNITIGDPLYCPFTPASDLDPETILNDANSKPYELILALNNIAKRDTVLAVEKAIEAHIKSPNLPLTFKILIDYANITSPTLTDLLYDYLSSVVEIEEYLAPLYIESYKKLSDAGDLVRASKILRLLEGSSKLWNNKLIEIIRGLSPESSIENTAVQN